MRARLPLLAVVVAGCCAALASSGCAAHRAAGTGRSSGPDGFDALMQSWHGQTVDDLFRTWGRPAFLYSDGEGGRIAVYVPAASLGTTTRPTVTTEPRQTETLRVFDPRMTDAWPIFRIFFADSTGHIVRSEWQGRWECCSS